MQSTYKFLMFCAYYNVTIQNHPYSKMKFE